jgi:acyl-coenzyme A thioesterase PaaI-like protein
MSEAAPGFPDSVAYVSPERARLAAAVRALIDASMTMPDATAEQLTDAATRVESVVASLAGVVDRTIAAGYSPRAHADYLPRSPAIGAASPLAPGTIDWDVVDDPERAGEAHSLVVVATGAMPAAYEGPPSFVHGGVVALMFDEILGIANIANGCPGMTGTLTIKYRRPTPLFQPLRWTAWIERVEGRRIRSRAQVHVGEELCAEADGIFVQPSEWRRKEYFGDVEPG